MINNNKKNNTGGFFIRFRKKVYPFFWFIGSGDETILMKCPASEQDKQAGIGLAILCTTIAAILSSFYAINSLFEQALMSMILALFWGIIIFNLDRFMVGSIKKKREKSFYSEMIVASPRILLAFFIAIVISKPLEVKIFQNQIGEATSSFRDSVMSKKFRFEDNLLALENDRRLDNKAEADRLIDESKNSGLDPEYARLRSEYNTCIREASLLETKIANLRKYRQTLIAQKNADRASEITRSIAAYVRQKNDLRCSQKKDKMEKREVDYKQRLLNQVAEKRQRIDKIDTSIAAVTANKSRGILNADSAFSKATKRDILGQIRILDTLTKKDTSMWWTGILITAIFFLLELAPLLVKIISPRGQYDILLSIAEQQALDNEEASIEESTQQKIARKNTALKNVQRIEDMDLAVQKNVQDKILSAQADLAEKIVEAWRQEEESLLKANPSAYIEKKITSTT